MALSYTPNNPAWSSKKRVGYAQAPKFGKLMIAAFLTLLNWSRFDPSAVRWDVWAVFAASLTAVLLIRRNIRLGIWIAAILGLGFLLTTIGLVPRAQLTFVQPFLLWAAGLFATSAILLWHTCERPVPKESVLERYAQF